MVGDLKNEILDNIKQNKVETIRLQFTDILGMPKNIVIPSSRLEEALEEGIMFDGSSIVGYATIEESDMVAKPDENTFTILPQTLERRRTAKFTCDIHEPNGNRFAGDPKYALERIMTKVKKKGYDFNVGPECEFFLFKLNEGKPTTIPNDKGGYFDLSPLDLAENIRGDISATLQELGFNAYTSHHEVAPSQHEINFHHADALTTADRVVSLIYVTKAIALRYGLHATFMPKPIYGINGSGMHTHQSLIGKEGNAFYDSDGKHELSDSAIHYIGGLLKYAREICAVVNSWVNSYKRLVPGYEAPTYISWANRNRSALVRIPSKRGEGTRCELRNPDAAGNPYLQFAVMLAAGFKGIEKKIEPPEPVEKDIYVLTQREREELGIEALPANLGHALSYMEKSELVLETLDTHIFTHFLHVKRNEWNDYRTQVTQWEIEKYLPIL